MFGGYLTQDLAIAHADGSQSGTDGFGAFVAIDGNRAFTAGRRGVRSIAPVIIDSNSGEVVHELSIPLIEGAHEYQRAIRTLDLEGQYAVVGTFSHSYVFNANSGELLHTLPDSSTLDIDGSNVILMSRSGTLVFDLATGENLASHSFRATSVAMMGDYAVLGVDSYARARNWRTGDLLQSFDAENIGGSSVAIEGNTVVVGGASNAVHVFDLDTGRLRQQLVGSDINSRSNFGVDVAIANGVVAVSAPRQRSPDSAGRLVNEKGAVYLFSATTGEELAKITSTDGRTGGLHNYGYAMDYDGSQLIAGAGVFPKAVYVTRFAIPEPGSAILISIAAALASQLRHRRFSASRT